MSHQLDRIGTYIEVCILWICHHSGISSGMSLLGRCHQVLFHPAAVHSVYAEGPPDPADFTIRAPFPTVHLLRSLEVVGWGEGGAGGGRCTDVLKVIVGVFQIAFYSSLL